MDAHQTQKDLTQCYNCQKFGNRYHRTVYGVEVSTAMTAHLITVYGVEVSTAMTEPPYYCLWCGGGHYHDCPAKQKPSLKSSCCNCKLDDGINSNLQTTLTVAMLGNLQQMLEAQLKGRLPPFPITPLHHCTCPGKTDIQQQTWQWLCLVDRMTDCPSMQQQPSVAGQSIHTSCVNSLYPDCTLRVAAVG
jgi:hypothetical protein